MFCYKIEADLGEVTVHVSEPTKKKKKGKNGKSKEHQSKNGNLAEKKQGGFDNPLYQEPDGSQVWWGLRPSFIELTA